MKLILIVSALLTFCACSKKVTNNMTLEQKTEQITKEMTILQEKQTQLSFEKIRDDKFEIILDPRMGFGSKISAAQDLMRSVNELLESRSLDEDLVKGRIAEEFALRVGDTYSQ